MSSDLQQGDLKALLAELSARADDGDEAAALRVNELAAQCTPGTVRGAADLAAETSALLDPSGPPALVAALSQTLLDIVLAPGSPFREPAPWRDGQDEPIPAQETWGALFQAFADDVGAALGIPPFAVFAWVQQTDEEWLFLFESVELWPIAADMLAEAFGLTPDPERPFFQPTIH